MYFVDILWFVFIYQVKLPTNPWALAKMFDQTICEKPFPTNIFLLFTSTLYLASDFHKKNNKKQQKMKI